LTPNPTHHKDFSSSSSADAQLGQIGTDVIKQSRLKSDLLVRQNSYSSEDRSKRTASQERRGSGPAIISTAGSMKLAKFRRLLEEDTVDLVRSSTLATCFYTASRFE
jgi:hypothetical protein